MIQILKIRKKVYTVKKNLISLVFLPNTFSHGQSYMFLMYLSGFLFGWLAGWWWLLSFGYAKWLARSQFPGQGLIQGNCNESPES